MKPRTHACADCPTLILPASTRCTSCNMRRVTRSPAAIEGRAAANRAKVEARLQLERAVEARRSAIATMAAERARVETLSPFERQERALRNGAALVANVRVTA